MTLCLTRMRAHLERRTVAVRQRGRERQILSPLSSFVASGAFFLLLSRWLLWQKIFMEPPWWRPPGDVFGIYAITCSPLAVTRARSLGLVCSCHLPSRSHVWIFTEPKLRGEERRVRTNGAFAHNASIKVKRRTYVQRTSPSCNRECSTVTRIKEPIKNVLTQTKIRLSVYNAMFHSF